MSNFHGTEIEIWACFGPVGSIEKKIWADYDQFFSCFMGRKKKKFILVRNVNVHRPSDMEAFRL